jgi:hypothetical protein
MINYKVTVKYNIEDNTSTFVDVFAYYFTKTETEEMAITKITNLLGNNPELREIPYNGEVYMTPTNTAVIMGAQEVVIPD